MRHFLLASLCALTFTGCTVYDTSPRYYSRPAPPRGGFLRYAGLSAARGHRAALWLRLLLSTGPTTTAPLGSGSRLGTAGLGAASGLWSARLGPALRSALVAGLTGAAGFSRVLPLS